MQSWHGMARTLLLVVVVLGACAGEPPVESQPAASTACTTDSAGQGWSNRGFPVQAGRFRVELSATPSAAPIDAVIGLSNGGATKFTQLATVVRFNDQGNIDVREGSTYAADFAWPYHAGTTYHIRVDVDVRAHTYTVWVSEPSGSPAYYGDYYALAKNVPFRTEQAGATQVSNLALEVDSPTGSIQVCDFKLEPATGGDCHTTYAGEGFSSQPISGGDTLVTSEFVVTPSAPDIDAVIGLSAAPAAKFTDLAVIVRFAPNGVIDVRNGDHYQSDGSLPYVAGSPYRIRFFADVATHTYGVMIVNTNQSSGTSIAWRYAFRSEQQAVASLGQLSTIVDSSSGELDMCGVTSESSTQLSYAIEGGGTAAPWGSETAIVGIGGDGVYELGERGEKLSGSYGNGYPAVGGNANMYVATNGYESLTVSSYTQPGALRWSTTSSNAYGTGVTAFGTTAFGDIIVMIGQIRSDARPVTSVRIYDDSGALRLPIAATAARGVVDRTGYALATCDGQQVTIAHYNRNGGLEWSHAYAGRASITGLGSDLDGGLAFGGTSVDGTTYVTKLAEGGATVFSTTVGISQIDQVATNGTLVAVSGRNIPTPDAETMQLVTFDNTGAVVRRIGDVGFGPNGQTYDVAIGPSGRIYWQIGETWQGPVMIYEVAIKP